MTRYHRLLLGPETLHLFSIAVETHFRCGWLMLQPVRKCCDFSGTRLLRVVSRLQVRHDGVRDVPVGCNVARVWSIGAFDQMRCAIDQFVISAAFYQLRNS